MDKYLPIRVQHQLSNLMHSILSRQTSLPELYLKFQDVECTMFQELHQIVFLDRGKTDIAEIINRMNQDVAKVQKIALAHDHSQPSDRVRVADVIAEDRDEPTRTPKKREIKKHVSQVAIQKPQAA